MNGAGAEGWRHCLGLAHSCTSQWRNKELFNPFLPLMQQPGLCQSPSFIKHLRSHFPSCAKRTQANGTEQLGHMGGLHCGHWQQTQPRQKEALLHSLEKGTTGVEKGVGYDSYGETPICRGRMPRSCARAPRWLLPRSCLWCKSHRVSNCTSLWVSPDTARRGALSQCEQCHHIGNQTFFGGRHTSTESISPAAAAEISMGCRSMERAKEI